MPRLLPEALRVGEVGGDLAGDMHAGSSGEMHILSLSTGEAMAAWKLEIMARKPNAATAVTVVSRTMIIT
jgi:hypothetical protein